MGAWAKIIAGLIGIADKVAAIFKTKQDQDAGAAKQGFATDEQTLETLSDVGAPVSRSESDELWDRNKAKYGDDGKADG